jgi:hypothetical protein
MAALSRLALRLATVEALKPYEAFALADGGDASGWPTLAGPNVRDSLIDPAEAKSIIETLPFCAVFTDDASSELQGTAPDLADGTVETVMLGIEIMLPVRESDADSATIAPTDSRAEAMLDLLETQITRTLQRARMNSPLRHVLLAVTGSTSRPWRDPDSGMKLTARRIEMTARIRAEGDMPETGTGLALLPSPLREVAQALPAGSTGAGTAAAIAAALIAETPFDALDLIGIAMNFTREAGSAAPLAADRSAQVSF